MQFRVEGCNVGAKGVVQGGRVQFRVQRVQCRVQPVQSRVQRVPRILCKVH